MWWILVDEKLKWFETRRERSIMRPIAVSFILLCAGCKSPNMHNPEWRAGQDLELPETWKHAATENHGDVTFGWLRAFDNQEMEKLVVEAIEHNKNFKVASVRLKLAKEGTVIGRAIRLPSLTGAGSASRRGARSRNPNGELHPWESSGDYGLSLNLSWEVDLWGRLGNLHRATLEDYQVELAEFRGARLSLAANTAKAWCNVIAARQQVELARKTRDSFLRNYRITERNYKAGDITASPLDVQFGRNNVAQAERALISRQLLRNNAVRALEVLLGRYPAAMIQGRDSPPRLTEEVPSGLPSDLLMRRPDLVAAAARIRASTERAIAARKDFLPSISLNSRGSTASDELSDLVANPGSILWNVASSISQPIYRGGVLRARARQAMAQHEAAIESFAYIALRAFQEVESALNTEHSLASQEKFLETELTQANLAETQASRDYSEGIVGILAVLEAQRRAFNARNAMISLRNQRLQTRLDLYLALGGDFGPLTANRNPNPLAHHASTNGNP